MGSLRTALQQARDNKDVTGAMWVVTDGVFSMEGDIAHMPDLHDLCNEFGAMLVVDDSHGTGVLGKTGRGTHEHYGLEASAIDYFTSTLGKALGGGAGGFIAGARRGIDLVVQRGRPTLFSNALPVPVACSADKAIEILMNEPQRVQRLRDNTTYARQGIRDAGFEVLDSPTAICPIIVGETAKAIAMSNRLLQMGVFVIGFGYPVVPEGTARLRTQISAAHTREHLDQLIDAMKKLKSET
jgi:glycine C-acetyltransferase